MKKRIMWGMFFLVMAMFVILGSIGMLGNLSVWTIVLAGFCVVWLINGIIDFSFGGMLFPVACLAILFDKEFGIENLTPWPVLAAALFGTIGLNMMFGGFRKRKIKIKAKGFSDHIVNVGVEESEQNDESFKCDVSFGSTIKYVNSQNLRVGHIENSFGNCSVYFDNARLGGGGCALYVETSFGKTTLYIPRDWRVEVNVEKAFGSVTESQKSSSVSENVLIVNGEVSFGNLDIVYV